MNSTLKRGLMLLTVVALVSSLALPVFAQQGGLLTDIPVVGTIAGGTFEGVLSITGFAIENGQLVVSGVLEGTATVGGVVTEISQTFTNILASLLGSAGGVCSILTLDLGPLDLDLLGLQVDLSAISLDVTAVRGPGRLLGNLLCAVAGLLDAGGPLSGLIGLLDQINNLL
jgi:hypothetical protein